MDMTGTTQGEEDQVHQIHIETPRPEESETPAILSNRPNGARERQRLPMN